MLETAAQWIAPAATMIAAMMTAANLGSRVTGWGFVVFSIGAIAWVAVALASGQQNLLLSNAFLLIVDLFGIWRWLGLRARYDKGAAAAERLSKHAEAPRLFQLSKIEGTAVKTGAGETIAKTVDAMVNCGDGSIAYLVVSKGGVGGAGETLHALGWGDVRVEDDAIVSEIDAAALEKHPALDPAHWPPTAEAAGAS
ncbi:PRC-barrel domain-containing protein [Sphingomonas bacterium]|uniref:PRC-barrel domain-containing protein n=1 Tax=Sphingomonas bacterium TaxID=1895847 RepID=UPI001575FFE8|nr:PRC-barrel domain-containing protein [Sphingomonas bacterium]